MLPYDAAYKVQCYHTTDTQMPTHTRSYMLCTTIGTTIRHWLFIWCRCIGHWFLWKSMPMPITS